MLVTVVMMMMNIGDRSHDSDDDVGDSSHDDDRCWQLQMMRKSIPPIIVLHFKFCLLHDDDAIVTEGDS